MIPVQSGWWVVFPVRIWVVGGESGPLFWGVGGGQKADRNTRALSLFEKDSTSFFFFGSPRTVTGIFIFYFSYPETIYIVGYLREAKI